MQTPVKFRCNRCEAVLMTDQKAVGRSSACPQCSNMLTVPAPKTLRHVAGDAYDLDLIDFDDVAEVIEDDEPPRSRQRGVTPVEIELPAQLGSLKAQVDQPTSNAMATTFLGAALVAIGAVLFAMLGGKPRA